MILWGLCYFWMTPQKDAPTTHILNGGAFSSSHHFGIFGYIHSSFFLGGYQKPSYSRFVRRGDDELKVVQALQFEI